MTESRASEGWRFNWKDWKSWLILFGVFTFFELFETFRFVLGMIANGRNTAYISQALSGSLLAREFLEVYCVALLVPLLWHFGQMIHFNKVVWWRWIPFNLILIAAFVIIHQILFRTALWGLYAVLGQPVQFGSLLGLTAWGWVAIVSIGAYFVFALAALYGLDALHRWRSEQLVSAQLSLQLSQARLRALQTQIHPHFLFNTLQSIAILIKRKPDAAEQMLIKLGELFRIILDHEERPLVPLREEIGFAKKYLEIQEIRFADQLDIQWEIASGNLNHEVPTLILQPLVENALEHGLSASSQKGRLTIGSKIVDQLLWLWVSDTGNGLKQRNTEKGIGLSNVEKRLQTLYGSQAKFSLETATSGITTALMQLPIRAGSH